MTLESVGFEGGWELEGRLQDKGPAVTLGDLVAGSFHMPVGTPEPPWRMEWKEAVSRYLVRNLKSRGFFNNRNNSVKA